MIINNVMSFLSVTVIFPDRIPVKTFIESVENFLRDQISGGFNKLVLSALYPPEGAEPPTIPQLESAWAELLPTVIFDLSNLETQLWGRSLSHNIVHHQIAQKSKHSITQENKHSISTRCRVRFPILKCHKRSTNLKLIR